MTEKDSNVLKQKTKQMICDGLLKSLEIVVTCHGENCSPRSATRTSNFDYIKGCTKDLLNNLSIPYCLDLYLDVDNKNGMNSVLIERWVFHYDNRKRDSKEGRITAVNRHVGILVRTLYCFVRLLPSFQLSTQSSHCPLSFHVYPVETDQQELSFPSKPLSYHFPPIPTQYGHFSLSLRYLDSQSIKAVYSSPRSDTIPIPTTNNDVIFNQPKYEGSHTRRHSIASTPEPIPIPKGQGTGKNTTDVVSTWGTYSGELRSPTQRPSDLNRQSVKDELLQLPPPPELTRNQSRSADSKPKYLLQDQYFGIPRSSERERSISVDKERNWGRSGRPPQHPETSFTSQASSPFSQTPAPFYIGGGSYTPSEGGNIIGLTEESPVDISPPFQIPCVGLLSTSPSTGPGSSIALLREQLIGNKTSEKYRLPHSEARLVQFLPELPESPFDNEPFFSTKGEISRLNRDSGQDSSISGLINPGGNADTDCIFAYDENDRDSLSEDDLEEMPFAWPQTPTDSFLPQKLPTNTRNPGFNQTDIKQSMIAQQCLAPPTLNGFDVLKFGNMRQNSTDAFAKFDQMKEFHISTLAAKS